jgi:hypothetical protein
MIGTVVRPLPSTTGVDASVRPAVVCAVVLLAVCATPAPVAAVEAAGTVPANSESAPTLSTGDPVDRPAATGSQSGMNGSLSVTYRAGGFDLAITAPKGSQPVAVTVDGVKLTDVRLSGTTTQTVRLGASAIRLLGPRIGDPSDATIRIARNGSTLATTQTDLRLLQVRSRGARYNGTGRGASLVVPVSPVLFDIPRGDGIPARVRSNRTGSGSGVNAQLVNGSTGPSLIVRPTGLTTADESGLLRPFRLEAVVVNGSDLLRAPSAPIVPTDAASRATTVTVASGSGDEDTIVVENPLIRPDVTYNVSIDTGTGLLAARVTAESAGRLAVESRSVATADSAVVNVSVSGESIVRGARLTAATDRVSRAHVPRPNESLVRFESMSPNASVASVLVRGRYDDVGSVAVRNYSTVDSAPGCRTVDFAPAGLEFDPGGTYEFVVLTESGGTIRATTGTGPVGQIRVRQADGGDGATSGDGSLGLDQRTLVVVVLLGVGIVLVGGGGVLWYRRRWEDASMAGTGSAGRSTAATDVSTTSNAGANTDASTRSRSDTPGRDGSATAPRSTTDTGGQARRSTGASHPADRQGVSSGRADRGTEARLRVYVEVDGSPTEGVPVAVQPTEGASGSIDPTVVETTADGTVTFDGLRAGSYLCRIDVDTISDPDQIRLTAGESGDVTLQVSSDFQLTTDQRRRLRQLRSRVESLSAASDRDVAIPYYFGTVVESSLDTVETLPDHAGAVLVSGHYPQRVATALLDATEDALQAIETAMGTKRSVDLFSVSASLAPAEIDCPYEYDVSTLCALLDSRVSSRPTQRLDDRFAAVGSTIEDERRRLADLSPVATLHDELRATFDPSEDRPTEAGVRAFIALGVLSALKSLFEQEPLRERLDQTVF